jgi:hypothetical protein
MTVERTAIEQQKWEMVKIARAAIRLSHNLAADRELNETLPRLEREFDIAIQRGELPDAIDVRAIVKGVLGE